MKAAKDKYWYVDNWHGETRKFADLPQAEAHALKHNMGVVQIFSAAGIVGVVTGQLYFA